MPPAAVKRDIQRRIVGADFCDDALGGFLETCRIDAEPGQFSIEAGGKDFAAAGPDSLGGHNIVDSRCRVDSSGLARGGAHSNSRPLTFFRASASFTSDCVK